MIEHIITLSKAQNKRIVLLAERAGYQSEHDFVCDMIKELADSKEMPELLGDLLAKELNDDKRLEHKEG